MSQLADRNLLIGILALQLNFVTRDQLVEAMHAWVIDKAKSLGQIFVAKQAMDSAQCKLLDALVDKHVEKHGGNIERSLKQLSTVDTDAKILLAEIEDEDLEATMQHLGGDLVDPNATLPYPSPSKRSSSRFRIIRPHAKGGLGEVYIAEDTELSRTVALKEIQERYADSTDRRERFLREAEITGRLEHPNIVPVYGLGTYDNGRPFYAMKFIKGDSLKDAIDKFHADRATQNAKSLMFGSVGIAFRELLRRFIDVCNAVHYAHSRGVLHRDLKPGNIMIGEYGETLVVDWGLAKLLGEQAKSDSDRTILEPASGSGITPTEHGAAMGTPAYMSPEQAAGKLDELGPVSDVYSLGVTLYYLLSGKARFSGDSIHSVLNSIKSTDSATLIKFPRSAPKALGAICRKAMALSPSDRYSSTQALAVEIQTFLADEPVEAFVEPYSARTRRLVRRHPAIVSTLLTCTLLGLCGALTVSFLQVSHANELALKNTELLNLNRELTLTTNAMENLARVADSQRKRAEQSEQEAIDAVTRFGEVVSDNLELKNNPQFESLRKQLLKEPLSFFKSLRERLMTDEDSRPESLSRLATSALELGKLTYEVSEKREALISLEEAKTGLDSLVSNNPENTAFQLDLVRTHRAIGKVLFGIGNADEGLRAYSQTQSICQRFLRENPTNIGLQNEFARTLFIFAQDLNTTSKTGEALAMLTEAKSILEPLVQHNPANAEYQSGLAYTNNSIGDILSEKGKADEALAACEDAKSICERLLQDYPSNAVYQSQLAYAYNSIGKILRGKGKADEALTAWENAKSIFKHLVQDYPLNAAYQSQLAYTYNSIGNILSGKGKADEALAAHEDAKTIYERLVQDNPSNAVYQSRLAYAYNGIGNILSGKGKADEALMAYDEANSIYDLLAKREPSSTEYQMNLAGVHNNIAGILENAGKVNEALTAYEQAKLTLERLVQNNPSDANFQSELYRAYMSIGSVLRRSGRTDEALTACGDAKSILTLLVQDNPSNSVYQGKLAFTLITIGHILNEKGRPDEALTACEEAKSTLERLLQHNPSSFQFRGSLAIAHDRIGHILNGKGRTDEALTACEDAKSTLEHLLQDDPSNTVVQQQLVNVHNNIGLILNGKGKTNEALTAYECAKSTLERLVQEYPSSTHCQIGLAAAHHKLGLVLLKAGNENKGLASYKEAVSIFERLLASHPSHTECQSELASAHSDIAVLHLELHRFSDARDLLNEAIKYQRRAVEGNPKSAKYRQSVIMHFRNLVIAARGLNDSKLAADAYRGLADAASSDPSMVGLDERLANAINSEAAYSADELVAFGERSYNLGRFEQALRFLKSALHKDSTFVEDRKRQAPFTAARYAALVESGQSIDELKPDEATRSLLRADALIWFKSELTQWKKALQSLDPQQLTLAAPALKCWQTDPDVASVRDEVWLAQLPDAERAEWQAFWERVRELIKNAEEAKLRHALVD